MLITRSPLRIGLLGGGTDLPAIYENIGGKVINLTIDKHVYVTVSDRFEKGIRLSYSLTEDVDHFSDIKHPIVKNVLNYFNYEKPIEITTVADIPSKGTGLGSSSSFTVGLVNAIAAHQGHYITPRNLAEIACDIEINHCNNILGKQDQYASALGGLNHLQISTDGNVDAKAIGSSPSFLSKLSDSLLCIFTGKSRRASKILEEQTNEEQVSKKINLYKEMHDLTSMGLNSIENFDIMGLSEAINKSWEIKRNLSTSISNQNIEDAIEQGLKNGAYCGKIIGAGSGGFLLFLADPSKHETICQSLGHLKKIPVRIFPYGSSVIFSTK